MTGPAYPPTGWPQGYIPAQSEWDTAFSNLLGALSNIAALQAAALNTLGQFHCYVRGHTSNGDGGEGTFAYNPADTTSADNGGTIIVDAAGRRWYRQGIANGVSPLQFGASSTASSAVNTAAVNAAMSFLTSVGGGTLWMPLHALLIDPVVVPAHVSVQGVIEGPFDGGTNPSTSVCAPTLLVNSAATPLITLGGYGASISDVLIYDPGQVAPTATTPTVRPAMIQATGAGNSIRRCTLVNAYVGVLVSVGRVIVSENNIGAYSISVNVDTAEDYVNVDDNRIEPFYDIFFNLTVPQTIDTWVMNNGIGIVIGRADAFSCQGNGIFVRYCGILLRDTPTAGFSPANGYGKFVNTDCDTCAYGVIASSTNPSGGGVQFSDLNVGGNPLGVGTASQAALELATGGASPPLVTWSGGAVRGTWAAGQTAVAFRAGYCNITNVFNINTIGFLTGTPAVPASNTTLSNPFPFGVRVFVAGTGFTVSTMTINGTSIPIGSTVPFDFDLNAGDIVSLNYSGPVTWQWFVGK